jgi:integrase
MLAAGHIVHPQFQLALVLVHETGHRLASVRQLLWSDIDLKARTVRWRANCDKIGFEGTTALTDDAVRALEAQRGREAAIGQLWVCTARRGKGATSRHTFAKWWTSVEAEAKITPVPGRQFHSLRRKFATEMKHAPLRDLAYLGGWKSVSTVVEVYQRPDGETMRNALAQRQAVRESANFATALCHQRPEHDNAPPTTRIANGA